MSMTNETEAVLKALATSDYKFRTLQGLSKEVGITPEKVRQVIVANGDKIRRSPIPDIHGQTLYTLREDFSMSFDAVTEPAHGIASTKPSDSKEIGEDILYVSTAYYNEALSQAKNSFMWALVVAIFGFVLFIGSLILLFTSQFQAIAQAGVIGGAIVEVVAGLQFYIYGKATAQLTYFHQSIDRIRRFLIANSICETLEGEHRQKSRAELVKLIALSAQQTSIISSEQSKINSS